MKGNQSNFLVHINSFWLRFWHWHRNWHEKSNLAVYKSHILHVVVRENWEKNCFRQYIGTLLLDHTNMRSKHLKSTRKMMCSDDWNILLIFVLFCSREGSARLWSRSIRSWLSMKIDHAFVKGAQPLSRRRWRQSALRYIRRAQARAHITSRRVTRALPTRLAVPDHF